MSFAQELMNQIHHPARARVYTSRGGDLGNEQTVHRSIFPGSPYEDTRETSHRFSGEIDQEVTVNLLSGEYKNLGSVVSEAYNIVESGGDE